MKTPEERSDWYDILDIIQNIKYLAGDFRDDIALLRVDLDEGVTAVCIGPHEPEAGDLVTVTGWGTLSCEYFLSKMFATI